jgi:hypothetical protein
MLEARELRALYFSAILFSGKGEALLGVHGSFRIEGILGFLGFLFLFKFLWVL